MLPILIRVRVAALGLAFAVSAGYLHELYTYNPPKPDILTFTKTDKNCKGCVRKKKACSSECAYAKLGKIVSLVENAKESVDVCVLLITNGLLADALIEAHKRGVKVRVIVDEEMSRLKFSQSKRLRENGLSLLENKTNATIHHRFCLIDSKRSERCLIQGSANWILQAFTGNFELVCLMTEEEPVNHFAAEFELLWNFFSDSKRNISQDEVLESLIRELKKCSSSVDTSTLLFCFYGITNIRFSKFNYVEFTENQVKCPGTEGAIVTRSRLYR